MSDEVLEASIIRLFESPYVDEWVEILWHAGEPLSAGLPFYDRARSLIQKHAPDNVDVVQAIQTNATLISEKVAKYLCENDFRVSVSIDGPERFNDANRVNWKGRGALKSALTGVANLRKVGIDPPVLSVLSREALDHPDEIFSFFVDEGFTHIGFNPEEVDNANKTSSLGSALAQDPRREDLIGRYRDFMARIFELWWPMRETVQIREIRDTIAALSAFSQDKSHVRKPDESEPFGILTVSKGGDVTPYSPEFSGSSDKFIIGNVLENSLEEMALDAGFVAMTEEIQSGRKACVESCKVFPLCGGAYISNRYFERGRMDVAECTTCILQRQTVGEVVIDGLSRKSVGERVPSCSNGDVLSA